MTWQGILRMVMKSFGGGGPHLPGAVSRKYFHAPDDEKVELTPDVIAAMEREVILDVARNSDHPAIVHALNQLMILTKLSHSAECAKTLTERKEVRSRHEWLIRMEEEDEKERERKTLYDQVVNSIRTTLVAVSLLLLGALFILMVTGTK